MKENEKHLIVDVEVRRTRNAELIDAIAASAKLSKADAGRLGNIKETVTINLDPCHQIEPTCGCPKVAVSYTTETNQ